jgi:hypothetical protein
MAYEQMMAVTAPLIAGAEAVAALAATMKPRGARGGTRRSANGARRWHTAVER